MATLNDHTDTLWQRQVHPYTQTLTKPKINLTLWTIYMKQRVHFFSKLLNIISYLKKN